MNCPKCNALDMAYYQLLGFSHKGNIIDLVKEMELEADEWENIKNNYNTGLFDKEEMEDIDEYFDIISEPELKSMDENFGEACDAEHRMSEAKKLK